MSYADDLKILSEQYDAVRTTPEEDEEAPQGLDVLKNRVMKDPRAIDSVKFYGSDAIIKFRDGHTHQCDLSELGELINYLVQQQGNRLYSNSY